MKKTIIWISLVAILVIGGYVLLSKSHRSSEVETAGASKEVLPIVAATRVTREDLNSGITLSAELLPYQDIEVHAKVAGYVQSIKVDIGDHVKVGDTLAILEIPELKDDLKKASATTRAAREEIKQAQAKYDEIHMGSQRLLEVAKQKPELVAGQDTDAAKAQDQAAEAALGLAKERLEECQANENKMLTMLSYAIITAPFDGVITKRYADTGALIQAGTASNTQAMPLVSLAQDSMLRLCFPVPESAVSRIRNGTTVIITVDSASRTFQGKIARFSSKVDRATRTMQVEVDVPNTDLQLSPGMYASAQILLEQSKGVLSVPVQSLAYGNKPTVWVIGKDGLIEEREIKMGLETPGKVEVREGVSEDEMVLVGSRNQLKPGDKVVPKAIDLVGVQDKKGGRNG